MVLGASESIDVLSPSGFLVLGLPVEDVLLTVDSRLRLRCILTKPTAYRGNADYEWEKNPGMQFLTATTLARSGWQVRTSKSTSLISCVIVDERQLAVVQLPVVERAFISSDIHIGRLKVLPYQMHLNRLWNSLESDKTRTATTFVTLWDDVLSPSISRIETDLVTVSKSYWDELIAYLTKNPEKLHGISPRKFEELIAEILSREGLETQLTPERKDGGFDVLAVARTSAGRHMYLVECKRYSKSKPVGVELVRALYGTVQQNNATAGLLVTTSRFTRGALDFQKPIEYRIGLKSYQELVAWLNTHNK